MCMRGWVKNCIATCEKFIFWCEKGYEGILALGSPQTTYCYRKSEFLYVVFVSEQRVNKPPTGNVPRPQNCFRTNYRSIIPILLKALKLH